MEELRFQKAVLSELVQLDSCVFLNQIHLMVTSDTWENSQIILSPLTTVK